MFLLITSAYTSWEEHRNALPEPESPRLVNAITFCDECDAPMLENDIAIIDQDGAHVGLMCAATRAGVEMPSFE